MTLENLKNAKKHWDSEATDEKLNSSLRAKAKEHARICAERITHKLTLKEYAHLKVKELEIDGKKPKR